MTFPEIVMLAVVLGVGIPSAWRNPTSGALVLCFVAAKALFLITGETLAVEYYIFPDIFVIAVIMSKPEDCNLAPYRNEWHRLQCLLLERSRSDRVVLGTFAVMWLLYAAAIHDYYRWYLLWSLAILQLLAAGWESFLSYRRDADAVSRHPEPPGTSLLVAYQGGGRFG